ncbi:MAG: MBL fold metallo-hydrolase [Siphonobacter sp.]
MALSITSLNSGSNGNCYYIGNEQEAILVDAGLSCRETEKRMHRLGLSMQRVKAIFISHEHTDHISGLTQLATNYRLPVYLSDRTLRGCRLPINSLDTRPLYGYQPIWVGELCITAFPKFHDAADPKSFIVQHQQLTVGVFTDIGRVCEHVITHFKQCHAIFLEANYDDDMLDRGRYPAFLKQRIRGGYGHLSNRQAAELFRQHRPAFMSHVLLSHLSQENNTPDRALSAFLPHSQQTRIIVASRHNETPVFTIEAQPVTRTERYPSFQDSLSSFLSQSNQN